MSALSNYAKVTHDPSILSRISEADVMAWMVAKLAEIRDTSRMPVYHMKVEVWHRVRGDEKYYDVAWDMHAPDICALTHASTASALAEVAELLNDNPRKQAQEKRWQAKRLLEEAEEFERVSDQAIKAVQPKE